MKLGRLGRIFTTPVPCARTRTRARIRDPVPARSGKHPSHPSHRTLGTTAYLVLVPVARSSRRCLANLPSHHHRAGAFSDSVHFGLRPRTTPCRSSTNLARVLDPAVSRGDSLPRVCA